jgi:hypothetical protein
LFLISEFVFTKVIPAVLAFTFFIVLGYCIWGLSRGFDIFDEAYFLLLAIYPDVFKAFVSGVQWVTSLLWAVTGSIPAFRASGLAIIIFGAVILALGAIRGGRKCGLTVAPGLGSYIAITSATLVAALHWNSYGVSVYFTPSYNLIVTAAAYSAAGFALLGIDRKSIGHVATFHFLAGASIGIALLCKFPAGISLLFLTLVLTAVFSRSLRDAAFKTSTTLIGGVAIIFVIVSAHMTPGAAIEQFKTGLSLYAVILPESTTARLMRNVKELLSHFGLTIINFAVPIICFGAFAWWGSRVAEFLGLGSLIFILVSGGYMLGGDPRLTLQITALVAFVLLFFLATFRVWVVNWKFFMLLVSLLGLPYCVAIGTANPLPPQVLVSLASWGTLFSLVAYQSSVVGRSRTAATTLTVLFTVTVATQVVSSGFYPTYAMSRALSEQTEPTTIGNVGVVQLDERTRKFVRAIERAAEVCAITPGGPFVGLYDVPGVALILQNIPILTPWLREPQQAEAWLRNVPATEFASATFAIRQIDGDFPKMPNVLSWFPKGYRLCGEGVHPYNERRIQIWVRDN